MTLVSVVCGRDAAEESARPFSAWTKIAKRAATARKNRTMELNLRNTYASATSNCRPSRSRSFAATVAIRSSVTGVLPFSPPKSLTRRWMNSVKPPNSMVFFAQSLSQTSTTRIRSAPRVLTSINSTLPAIPARQKIFASPALWSVRTARSPISAISAAPEQENIRSVFPEQEHLGCMFMSFPFFRNDYGVVPAWTRSHCSRACFCNSDSTQVKNLVTHFMRRRYQIWAPRRSSCTTPAAFSTDRCLETVDMSEPTSAVKSQTHRSDCMSSSTMSKREGCPSALKTCARASYRAKTLESITAHYSAIWQIRQICKPSGETEASCPVPAVLWCCRPHHCGRPRQGTAPGAEFVKHFLHARDSDGENRSET